MSQSFNNFANNDVTLGTNGTSVTIQPGTYEIEYIANSTDTTAKSLAFYSNGEQISPTLSSSSAAGTLTGKTIITITDPDTMLEVRNAGTEQFSLSGITLFIENI